MSRRKERRKRIEGEIRHYLYAHRYGEWVLNHDIIRFLDHTSRGRRSYNSLNSIALGQILKSCEWVERKEDDVNSRRGVFYRYVGGEEE